MRIHSRAPTHTHPKKYPSKIRDLELYFSFTFRGYYFIKEYTENPVGRESHNYGGWGKGVKSSMVLDSRVFVSNQEMTYFCMREN